MLNASGRLRVATYNVHKCRGLDGRLRPDRIAAIIRGLDADIVALQEVVSIENRSEGHHQAAFIATQAGHRYHIGENRRHNGGAYGNVILSRLPVTATRNYDITWHRCEPRGCLRADLELPGGQGLHIFNAHLGTAYLERRHQGRRLISGDILNSSDVRGPRILLGDFNEWTRGLCTRLLGSCLESADIREHLRRARTYPGVFPLLHLDHVYYDRALRLERLTLVRNPATLVASDHLPLVADFLLP